MPSAIFKLSISAQATAQTKDFTCHALRPGRD